MKHGFLLFLGVHGLLEETCEGSIQPALVAESSLSIFLVLCYLTFAFPDLFGFSEIIFQSKLGRHFLLL